jgi:acetyltransferase-like isoleucine patch superfamily enzyme
MKEPKLLGAGAVVTRDITEPGVYAGNPARRIRSL